MLDSIKGLIKSVHSDAITVDIGVVVLRISVPLPASFEVGASVNLHVYMHWNQENGPSLYGFLSELEKEIFLLVIGCSGVGPRLGLAVLQDLGPQAFLDAISNENDKALSTVSGIGAKKAEQIVVQLKHKVAKLIESGTLVQPSARLSRLHELSDVLRSLNYSRPEISAAMNHLNKNYTGQDCSFDQLIRHALSFLTKKGATR